MQHGLGPGAGMHGMGMGMPPHGMAPLGMPGMAPGIQHGMQHGMSGMANNPYLAAAQHAASMGGGMGGGGMPGGGMASNPFQGGGQFGYGGGHGAMGYPHPGLGQQGLGPGFHSHRSLQAGGMAGMGQSGMLPPPSPMQLMGPSGLSASPGGWDA